MEPNSIFKTFIIVTCISGIYGLYWPCDSDAECNTAEGAFCLNEVCQCPVGYVFSEDITTCIKDTDCIFGYDRDSVVCKENLCECSEDFYERSENICRRKSMNVGEPCLVHSDCKGDFLECTTIGTNSTCTATVDSANNNESRRLSREIGIQTSIDVIETKDVSTSIDKSTILIPQKAPKIQGRQYGEACTTENAPCDEFSHSICVQGACQCRKGYYLRNGLCKAEVGEVADSEVFCEGDDTFYDATTRKCSCIRNYFVLNNLRSCIKPSASFANSCTEQSQCSPYGAAYCPGSDQRKLCTCHNHAVYDAKSQLCVPKIGLGSLCRPTADDCSTREAHTVCTNNNLCSCQEKYVEVEGKCKPGEYVDCAQDSDCAMKNSECIDSGTETNNKTCRCKKGFIFIKDDCLKEANEYNEECIENEQCTPLLGDLGKCVDSKCSSDRPSVLKVITLLLTTAAILITTAAIKEAYY